MVYKLTDIYSSEEIQLKLNALSESTGLHLDSVDFLQAMTHRSFVFGESSEPVEDNERLEFLGDSIANMIVTEYLYGEHQSWAEGRLSQSKSILVGTEVFADCARKLGLDNHLIMSETERNAGANNKSTVLEDAFEAFIGVYYQQFGLEACKDIFKSKLFPYVNDHLNNPELLNGKSLLMEHLQAEGFDLPVYEVIRERGLDHEKLFTMHVKVGGVVLAIDEGSSKKKVEKSIAFQAYQRILEDPTLIEGTI